jgi:putative Holliday junction resolvase
MARIMAVDYGTKRVGIAVTDPENIIATGLATVHSKNVINFLKDYLAKEEVERVVVGDPGRLGRNDTMARHADNFCKELVKNFPFLIIERLNEFYTSKLAERTLSKSGLKKQARRNKALVDKISAILILQSYLELKNRR